MRRQLQWVEQRAGSSCRIGGSVQDGGSCNRIEQRAGTGAGVEEAACRRQLQQNWAACKEQLQWRRRRKLQVRATGNLNAMKLQVAAIVSGLVSSGG